MFNSYYEDEWLPDGSGTVAQRRYSVQPELKLNNDFVDECPKNKRLYIV